MSHFFESSNHGNGLLSVEEEAACFGFRGGCGDGANGFAKNVNGDVGLGVWGELVALARLVRKKWPAARLRAFGRTR